MMQGPLACFRRNPQPPADDRRCSTWNTPARQPAIGKRRRREGATVPPRHRTCPDRHRAKPPQKTGCSTWNIPATHPAIHGRERAGGGYSPPAPPNLPGPPPPRNRPKPPQKTGCSTWNIPATHPAIHRRGRKRERAVGGHRPRATEPARTATPTNPRQAAPKNWVFHVEHPSQPQERGRPGLRVQTRHHRHIPLPPPADPFDDSPPGSSHYDWGTGRPSTRTRQLGATLNHDERGT